MYSAIRTAALWGLSGQPVTVETDLLPGLPGLALVGLPDQSVKESRERVKSAMLNSGCGFPGRKIVVNLSPADRRKDGSHFDLPIAAGILCACGDLDQQAAGQYAMIGELSLNGQIKGVTGALSLVLAMRSQGWNKVILPKENSAEVGLIRDMELYPAAHLSQVVAHLQGRTPLLRLEGIVPREEEGTETLGEKEDFGQVVGQEAAKRCVILACAGMHGLLMNGPPGVGKTMIARRIPTVLPQLTYEEMLEVTQIYSAANGLHLREGGFCRPPFRAPHYGISPAAMVGGGRNPRPGEVSLSHGGVLFLDELPLFRTEVLELLRTPLEEGTITVSRTGGSCTFPSRFMLVAAANPCRCGHYGDPNHRCRCTQTQLEQYRQKMSGPLLDRMDLQIYLNAPEAECRFSIGGGATVTGMTSAQMRERVEEIRQRQVYRYREEHILYNSQLTPGLIEKYCKLKQDAQTLFFQYIKRFSISVRAQHRILKTARTAADGDGCDIICAEHLAEALQYRGGWDGGKETA